MSFWTTLISVIDLLGCTVLLPGGSKVGKNLLFFCNLPEFLQLWRILEGERCTLANWSLRSKLFKMTFLTTFISTSTMYNQNWKRWFFIFFKNNGKISFYRYKNFSPKFTEWAFIPFESWENLLFSGIKAQTVRILSRLDRFWPNYDPTKYRVARFSQVPSRHWTKVFFSGFRYQ